MCVPLHGAMNIVRLHLHSFCTEPGRHNLTQVHLEDDLRQRCERSGRAQLRPNSVQVYVKTTVESAEVHAQAIVCSWTFLDPLAHAYAATTRPRHSLSSAPTFPHFAHFDTSISSASTVLQAMSSLQNPLSPPANAGGAAASAKIYVSIASVSPGRPDSGTDAGADCGGLRWS